MEEVKVTAKSIEDAITDASLKLGIPSSEMDYEVVDKGSTGFLGIGKKDVVIVAKKKSEKSAEKKEAPKKEAPKKEAPKQEAPKQEAPKQEVPNTTAEKKEREITPVTVETQKICETFTKETVEKMGLKATVSSEIEEDGSLYIDVAGEDMGILIGKRGQTLDSLQYLINRVANKNQDGYVRIKLDTEDYRSRRKATLENLAKNIAYKVKRNRKNVALEPMNPYERRIIHAALQEDEKVTTFSEGNEPYRHVVVTLKK